jgi:uncharacterized protein YggE
MRGVVAVLVPVIAAVALGAPPAAAQDAVGATTLATSGRGEAALTPDQAQLFVGVDRIRATSGKARRAANRRVASVQRALRARGIPQRDVQTAGVSVTRERIRARRGRPARVRHRATAQLTVTSRDVPGLGRLIDALSDAGADDVFGPDFSFTDPSQGTILATRAALADARRRADDAAAQLGVRITGIASVDLDPPLLDLGGDDDAGGGALDGAGEGRTRISPGRERFVVRVRVVYTVTPPA